MKFYIYLAGLLAFSVPALSAPAAPGEVFQVAVTEKGFEPNTINAPTGKPVSLVFTRKTDATCATQVQIPAIKLKRDLPLNKPVTVALGSLKNGEIRFACGMDMLSGVVSAK